MHDLRFVIALTTFVVAACGPGDNNAAPPQSDAASVDMGRADSATSVDAGTDDASPTDGGPTGVDRLFEQGPHAVGFVEFEITYDAPGVDQPRVLPIKAWYPAVPGSDAEQAQYAVAGVVDVTTDIAQSEPAPADGEFPVLVYSHGSGGEGLLGYPFGENFASWGWVVVAPNHVGNTALDAIRRESAPFAQTTLHRVTDISALLDAVASGATGSAVDGHADMEQVAMFGHSFGGYTTLAAGGADFDYDALAGVCPVNGDDGSCDFLAQAEVETSFKAGFGDGRLDAIVAQAPALVGQFVDGELASIDVPTMIQSGDRDTTTPSATQAEPAWNALDGASDVWVRMPDGGHFTFISICYDLSEQVLRAFRPDADADGCGEDFIDAEIAVPVLNAYVRAFAETHVLGSQEWSDVLDGSETLDDGFVVITR